LIALDAEILRQNITVLGKDEVVKIKPFIGEGKFGKVYKGVCKGDNIALKKMIFDSIDEDTLDEIITEIKNLQYAVCPEVPKFYGVWKGKKQIHYHLVFEFIEGKTLREVIHILTFEEKIKIIYQTAEVMGFLHKRKLYHRDIKPENIMILPDMKTVKLIDFGTAKLASKTITYTSKAIGTTFYMAPDYFDFDEESESDKPISYNHKVYIWSIGCMISEILTGIYPWFNVTKNENKVEAHLIKKSPFPIPKEIDEKYPQFKPLIENCLKIKPDERYECDQIMAFLIPFMQ